MNNTTLYSCGLPLFPLDPTQISSDLQAAFIARIVINAFTCPLIVLLNILVMVAVKTKRQLRTKSNIALACLATTDLMVGIFVQPLQTASTIFLLNVKDKRKIACAMMDVAISITLRCASASIFHSLLLSAERYTATKHSLVYEHLVTEVRIIIASVLLWTAAIIAPYEVIKQMPLAITRSVQILFFLVICTIVYLNVAVYMEVRRNEKHIAANQVSLEAKEKFLKNKKALYTSTIVLLAILLCYIPHHVWAILLSFSDTIPSNVGQILMYSCSLLPLLNSLINPLIYAVRIRYFRVAFIQLLTRKTTTQAQDLEMKIFGPRQIGVIGTAEQQQEIAGRENDEQGQEH